MTESQIWSDYFAVREADQLRRFPISAPLTPLQQAQYELAVEYFRNSYPPNKLRMIKEKLGLRRSQKPVVFRADAATRKAFFEHFDGDRVRNIYCWRREEWTSLAHPEQEYPKLPPYTTSYHEFVSGAEAGAEHMELLYGFTASEEWLLYDLVVRSWGSILGSLSGEGGDSIWHWDGQKLTHLDKYDCMWVS